MTGTWRDAYVARGSDYLITTSKRLKDRILERTGVAGSKITVVYGGVDLAQFRTPLPSRTELGLPEGALLFGYVGLFKSLGNEKGLRTMITALTFLPDNVHAAFVGGTKQEIEEYKDFARSQGVETRCVWIEKQPQERVQAYQRSMDVLVIPYPNQKHFRDYGFPMKVYEYLAAGRPIAYSRLAILDEVLSEVGTSFEPENPEALSQTVQAILAHGDAGNTEEMAREYSWNKKAERILALFTENR